MTMIKPRRPKVELLSKHFVEKIVGEALALLEKQGVFVENDQAMELLWSAGQKIDRTGRRVFIKSDLVDESVSSAPAVIRLYDRSGRQRFVVGRDEVHFDPGSAAVTLLDHFIQAERKAVTGDVVKFVRLSDALPHFHFQSTGLVSSDVPNEIADVYRLYIALHFSSKPVITGTFRVEGFQPMADMLAAVRGGADKLAEKPLAVFDACPSPPLKWSNLTAQSLIDAARAGIPSELISMGLTGATSPVTIAGTLVQHVAENLSGVVITQLAKEGAPVIFGGSPAAFDNADGGDRNDDDRYGLCPDRQVPWAADARLHGAERRQDRRRAVGVRDRDGRRPRRPGGGQRRLGAGHAQLREHPEPGKAGDR
jgi:trimethylamine---corrinoid protein Co-methyltransferase